MFINADAVTNKLPVFVVPPPPLPVFTVIGNVVPSPFVNVIVLRFTDAVIKDDAVTDELTKPNAVI